MSTMGNKTVFAKNLQRYIAASGKSRSAICEELGIAYSTFSEWANARKYPRIDAIGRLAQYFGIKKSDLIEDVSPKPESNIAAIYDDHIRMVPVFESVSAGFGALAENSVVDYLPLRIVSDYEASETICIRVQGDSMFPKIENGDIIQVHKQESVDSGEIAVVLLDGDEGLVKKVVYGSDWIELHSINPMYPVQRFENADVLRLRVVGKVKGVFKAL
ncbi:MAG: XRE family transcriptional regulator [Oscillospiraceae bacterium]|nr:XRE family transcriptional regulator [Oscillospiraceae bacterium]